MKTNILSILFLALIFTKCTPQPLPIVIEELKPKIAISSIAIDANTVMVIASYSVNSLTSLNYSANANTPVLPDGILIDNAIITISDGTKIFTLDKIYPGIYSKTDMNLTPGTQYNLSVTDLAKGEHIVAKTTYYEALPADKILPVVTRNPHDTSIQLKLSMQDNSTSINYYVMAYDRINPNTVPSPINSPNFSIVGLDAVKKVEIFSSADAVNGMIYKTFDILNIKPSDTLFVHYGKIDKGYFNYIKSYKKTGSLVNQITAEPITLPTNTITGFGYFALYGVQRSIFDLNKY